MFLMSIPIRPHPDTVQTPVPHKDTLRLRGTLLFPNQQAIECKCPTSQTQPSNSARAEIFQKDKSLPLSCLALIPRSHRKRKATGSAAVDS
jgi:hypothetical protein